tara:strand:+ start:8648 stop:8806 length:159 start_codon:yes stop_codon:yes gene_type:complete
VIFILFFIQLIVVLLHKNVIVEYYNFQVNIIEYLLMVKIHLILFNSGENEEE